MPNLRTPKSPWQKYNKKSQVYSPLYQMWREEVLKNGAGSSDAIALSCRHAKSMRVKNSACETI